MNFLDSIFTDEGNKNSVLEEILTLAKRIDDKDIIDLTLTKLGKKEKKAEMPENKGISVNPFEALLSGPKPVLEEPKPEVPAEPKASKVSVLPDTGPVLEGTEEPKEDIPAAETEADVDNPLLSFGKKSISGKPKERPLMAKEEKKEEKSEKRGLVSPFGDKFVNTLKMPIRDCIFSMFMGEISHDKSPYTEDIYFMVAPFEMKESAVSAEILFYIFYNGMGYIYSSIDNKENKSCYVEIPASTGGTFSFIARGKWDKGKWSASVVLGISSARNKDVFSIKAHMHNNPEKAPVNPHPRFHYEGFINRDDLVSVGTVDVFPVDGSGESFIAVRCIEDFKDYIDLSLTPECEIKRTDRKENMTVSFKDDIISLDFAEREDKIRQWI